MQITLTTQGTAEELAGICNKNESQYFICCPCAGFTCPLPDKRCGEVKATHWRAILQDDKLADPYSLKVDKLRLPTRTTNALHKNRIHSVGKLMEYPASRLVLFWGLGTGGVHDIECALAEHGLALAPEDENAGA